MISYLLDLEVSAVDRWKASPCDVLRHTCLNWWEAELQRTWEKNHQLSVGAGSPIRRDVCLLLLLQRYKDLGEIPKYHPTYSCTTAPNHPHPVIIRYHWGWQQGNPWGQYSDSSSSSAGSWAPPCEVRRSQACWHYLTLKAPRPQGPPSCGWTPQSSW